MQTRIKKGYKANAVCGFTLAELLVILLISSIIMVVLAPVVRKKQNSNTGSNSSARSQVQSVTYTYNSTNAECSRSASDNTLKCNFKVPQGVKFLNIHMVAGGGGGGGASTPTIKSGNSLTHGASSQKNLTISEGMRNVKIAFLTGGGGGGGGGAWTQADGMPASQADCDKYNALFIPSKWNGSRNVCATKFNVGDLNGPSIKSGITVANGGRNCTGNYCCWRNNTCSPCTNSGSWNGHSSSYSGCHRTVCTWYAANDSCNAWAPSGTNAGDWRLPTNTELRNWGNERHNISLYLGSDGLQLCDDYDNNGSIVCYTGSGRCPGSFNGNCNATDLWSGTSDGAGRYYYIILQGGNIGYSALEPKWAFTGRCVFDGSKIKKYTSRGGGGGGAAPYLKNYTIPQNIIEQCVGGKIVLYAGAGGTGSASGASSGSSGTAGSAGGTSYIYVYNKSNQLKWGFQVPGGNGGGRATSSAAGAAGAAKAINTCKIYNGSSWQAANCTSAGLAGSAGSSVTNISGTGGAAGGRGGHSYYGSSSAAGGGAGASASNQNGSNGTRNGAGAGGGGGSVRVVNDTIYKGTGGKGSVGVAQITYDLAYQAAAGGGGGGGAYAYVENVPVTPEKTYTVKVGGGGNGGSVNNNGTAGGATSVMYDGGTYILNGGGGGKKGTSATQNTAIKHGTAGAAGTTNIPAKFTKAAQAGTNATVSNNVSIGGNGGKSGISTPGGCGGFTSASSCSNASSNGSSPAYVAPGDLYNSKNYGKAGAGGGGGGWKMVTSSDSGPGGGAVGIPGYVYIYWIKYE